MATYRTVEPAGVTEGMNGSVERQALLLGRRPFLIKNLARLSLENLRAHISASTTSVETRLVLSPSGLSFGEKRRSSMKSPSSSSLAEPLLPYRMTDLTLVNNVFQVGDIIILILIGLQYHVYITPLIYCSHIHYLYYLLAPVDSVEACCQ